jgi:hypothetical protein
MGLWLKCPKCQAQNPLSVKICPHCGRDLDKLTAAQRVYVMGPAAAGPAKSKPAAASGSGTPSPEAGAAPKPAKQPKKAPKKKS